MRRRQNLKTCTEKWVCPINFYPHFFHSISWLSFLILLLLHASSWFSLTHKKSCNIKLLHYSNRYTAWYSSLLTWTMEFNRRKRQFLCNILVLHFFGIFNLKCSVILLHQHFSTYIVQCANQWAVLQWQSCLSQCARHALHNKWYKPSEMPRWYPPTVSKAQCRAHTKTCNHFSRTFRGPHWIFKDHLPGI